MDRPESIVHVPSRLPAPSPKLRQTSISAIIPISSGERRESFRRVRSLSTQQQNVISAEGEAAIVLRNHGNGNVLDSSIHEKGRKNSLDNSNHGYNPAGLCAAQNTLDYSFHGNDLPDDLPDNFVYEKVGSGRLSSIFSVEKTDEKVSSSKSKK